MNVTCCGKVMHRTTTTEEGFVYKIHAWKCSVCKQRRTQRLRKAKGRTV